MKIIFKIFSVILAAAICLGCLAGCKSSKNDNKTESNINSEVNLSSAAEAVNNKNYTVAVCTDFAPFGFTEENESRGIDIDLINAIAENQNVKFNYLYLTSPEAAAALNTGKADAVIGHIRKNESTLKAYDFSETYYVSKTSTASPENSAVSSLNNAKGKTAGVIKNSAGYYHAEAKKNDYGFDVKAYKSRDELYDGVLKGEADFLFDNYENIKYASKSGKIFNIFGESSIGASFALAVKKGTCADIIDVFNTGLKNLKSNGRYDKLINVYVG